MREGVLSRISRTKLRVCLSPAKKYTLSKAKVVPKACKRKASPREKERESRETLIISREKFQQTAEECTLMVV